MLNRPFCKSSNQNNLSPIIFSRSRILKILARIYLYFSIFCFQILIFAQLSNAGNIRHASDLSEQDFDKLIPTPQGIQYLLYSDEQCKIKSGIKYKIVETSFITLLPIDYQLITNFVNESFLKKRKLKSVDGIMEALPNLMNYLQTLSSGKITKKITQRGNYKNVFIVYTIDKDTLAQKYPRTKAIISQGNIRRAGISLLDEEHYPLIELKMKDEKITIQFSTDNEGYIVNPQNLYPKRKEKNSSALTDLFFYLDFNFDAEATLMKILRLCTVKVDKIRFLVNLNVLPKAITLRWETIDVQVRNVVVTGFNASAIKKSLADMKGTFHGEINFEPIHYRGEPLTFMQGITHGESIDDWLVNLAILTWEHIGLSVLNELRVPIEEGLSAFKKDLIANSTIR